jgi:hypothetical protein
MSRNGSLYITIIKGRQVDLYIDTVIGSRHASPCTGITTGRYR